MIPLDQKPLISSLSSDPDMIDLVEEFIAALPDRLNAIEQALATEDMATVARLAHQLKGAGGGYGFMPIGEAAASLEQAAKTAETVAQLHTQVQELVLLCKRAKATPE